MSSIDHEYNIYRYFKHVSDYNYTYSYNLYANDQLTGFSINKPIDPTALIKSFPNLKAIRMEFSKTAFRKSFDSEDFINQILKDFQLELLHIERGHSLTSFSDEIGTQPLRFLNVAGESVTDFTNVLSNLSKLEQLDLTCSEATLGLRLSTLSSLSMLRLVGVEVRDLKEVFGKEVQSDQGWLSKLTSKAKTATGSHDALEFLELQIVKMKELPADINLLRNLRFFSVVQADIEEIREDLVLPKLEKLSLHRTVHLQKIPKGILEGPALKFFDMYTYGEAARGSLSLPESLNMPSLIVFQMGGYQLEQFPMCDAPKLQKLTLSMIPIKEVLNKLPNSTNLKEIELYDLALNQHNDITQIPSKKVTSFLGPLVYNHAQGQMNFTHWPLLEQLELQGSEALHQLEFKVDFSQNAQLRKLTFTKIESLSVLSGLPENIEDLTIQNCVNLEVIDLKGTSRIKFLRINNLPALKEIRFENASLTSLYYVSIEKCSNLKRLNLEILTAPKLDSLNIGDCGEGLVNPLVDDISKLLKFMDSKSFSKPEKLTLGYWLFNESRFTPVTQEIKEDTLSLLQYSNDILFSLISSSFDQFSNEGKGMEHFDKSEIKDKSIAIVGNTFDTKTSIKNSLKNLQMKVTTKVSEADFVIVGKKSKLDFSELKKEVILVTEASINAFLEQYQPKFLQQESTTDQHVQNLRQILWSNNPETELMALEMLKNGGLRSELIGECIVIAKTSNDKSVKTKYKSFLKGKISEEALKLISKNVRFDKPKSRPFYNLSDFSTELVGKFALALYKRTNEYWPEVLWNHHADYDLRMEIIQNHIIPQVLNRPHYLDLHHKLTVEEVNLILEIPEIQGKVKRVILYVNGSELPPALSMHSKTLKNIEINGDLTCEKIPEFIYECKRLSELRMYASKIEEIDSKIEGLSQLKTIHLHSKKEVKLPEELKTLPKLTRVHFFGGVQDRVKWEAFLEEK